MWCRYEMWPDKNINWWLKQNKRLTNNIDDALAKSIRKKLKARGVDKGIKVVYSNEKTTMGLMPLKDH